MIRHQESTALYTISRLPSGLTVASAEMPQMTSVSLGLWVSVGSRFESEAFNGSAHFIEHMLFKGTRRRNALQISQAVEGAGGYLNAFTSEESSCFYAKAAHGRFEELLDVLSDMYLNSTFSPHEIRKEREVIKEEVSTYYDDPQQHVLEVLNSIQWPDQPLGRSITGTLKGLDKITQKELIHFLSSHYKTENTFIVAAGKITHQQVEKAVRRIERFFSKGHGPGFEPARIRKNGPAIELQTRDTEQTHMALGIRTCSRHDPLRFSLRLLNVILGENMSSRLFQKLREEMGLAYSVQSSVSFFDDTGDIVVAASLDTEKLRPALRCIRSELASLARRSPSRRELQRAQDYVIGQIDLSLENTESQMMNLGEQLAGWRAFVPPSQIKPSLAAVYPGDIKKVAADFYQPDHISLALVSPLKKTGLLAQELVGP